MLLWRANMKLSKKKIILGVVFLVLLWAGNIIYYEKHVLKEPLFINHYYNLKTGMNDFRLYYIQNINSQDRVISIVFPEIGQQFLNFSELDGNSDSNRRYYMLKTITVNLFNGGNEIPEEYKNKVITKAQICFSSGKKVNTDLGKIYLDNNEIEKIDLKQSSTSSSSDNTGSSTFIANKDINVTGINSKFQEELKDILQINIDGIPLSKMAFPIKLKAGTDLNLSYSFIFNKNDIRKNNAYFFTLDLLTEDFQGNKGTSSCFVNYCAQDPAEFDIDVIKNVRRDK